MKRRPSRRRSTLPALRIACEGETEKVFLKRLRGYWDVPGVDVEAVGRDPLVVVKHAIKMRDAMLDRMERRARKAAKKNDQSETWAVFDRDTHPQWDAAIALAQRHGVHLAISNPCFELWAVLLFTEQTAHITGTAVQKALTAVHPIYRHDQAPYLDFDTAIAGVRDADARAERLLRRAVDHGDERGNPTTTFHRLVERFRSLSPA